jgi:hypothetical protein
MEGATPIGRDLPWANVRRKIMSKYINYYEYSLKMYWSHVEPDATGGFAPPFLKGRPDVRFDQTALGKLTAGRVESFYCGTGD